MFYPWRVVAVAIAGGAAFLTTGVLAADGVVSSGHRPVGVWLCLERCNATAETVASNLNQVRELAPHVIGAVSFEKYNLGPNSTLVHNDLTPVGESLKEMGVKTYPMVSSFPYPPDFMDWIRQVWADPDPFVDSCIEEARIHQFDGYNIDWEPTQGATADDAKRFAAFLSYVAKRFSPYGLEVTVAAGTWSPMWNYTILAESAISTVATMSTYTTTFATFAKNVPAAKAALGDKLAIGMMTDQKNPYNATRLERRFQLLQDNGISWVWIWKFSDPLSNVWVDQLKKWVGVSENAENRPRRKYAGFVILAVLTAIIYHVAAWGFVFRTRPSMTLRHDTNI